jgi:hypothetical protein
MKWVFKIAGGVFLGIIAVIIALAIPHWRRESRQAEARLTMIQLTPEQVIARCGKPTEDQMTENDSAGVSNRLIVYANLPSYVDDTGKVLWPHPKVGLGFDRISGDPQWHFTGMDLGLSDATGVAALATAKIDDPVEQLTDLPCLAVK